MANDSNKNKMATPDKNKMAAEKTNDSKNKMAAANDDKMAAGNKADSEDKSDALGEPPDGGYGWVIVLAAFMCNMITDGISFSFGVLFDDLLDHFHDSKSKTSFIGSIFMGVPLLASPIASALINKYGCRTVCIMGGLLSTAGFVMSYFANSVDFLCISFGLVSGVGLSMVYTPAVVIVAFYFEKRRALATGLSVAGSGIGTLAFAPLVETLTANYGWRGTILILSGVMLNTCVFGALFRPLAVTLEITDGESGSEDKKTTTVDVFDSACSSHIAQMRELYSDSYSHSLIQFPTYLSSDKKDHSNSYHHSNGYHDDHQKRRETVPALTLTTSDDDMLRLRAGTENRDTTETPHSNNHPHNNDDRKHSNDEPLIKNGGNHCPCHNDDTKPPSQENHISNGKPRSHTIATGDSKTSGTDYLHPLYRRDIFYKGSLLWLPQNRHPARVSSCPDLYIQRPLTEDDPNTPQCCQWKHVKHVVKEMLDISIFRQPLYTLFFISNFFLYMWYDIPYFYLPNSATSSGLSEDEASWIISIIGIGNTIGQVAFGVVADYPRFNNSFVYGLGIFLCGISVLFIPLCRSMLEMSIVGSLFGLFIGVNYALCSIIIVDLLSLEKLTNAYGIMLCGQGIANLIGPPLGGLLVDYTHSYLSTYISAGAFIALSGLLMIIVAVNQILRPAHRPDHAQNQALEGGHAHKDDATRHYRLNALASAD